MRDRRRLQTTPCGFAGSLGASRQQDAGPLAWRMGGWALSAAVGSGPAAGPLLTGSLLPFALLMAVGFVLATAVQARCCLP